MARDGDRSISDSLSALLLPLFWSIIGNRELPPPDPPDGVLFLECAGTGGSTIGALHCTTESNTVLRDRKRVAECKLPINPNKISIEIIERETNESVSTAECTVACAPHERGR